MPLFHDEITGARDWTFEETGDVYRGELRSVTFGRAFFEHELNCEAPDGEPFTIIVEDLDAVGRELVRRLIDGREMIPGDTMKVQDLAAT